jgi:hypothetical protein
MPSGVMPTVANSLGTASSLSAAIVQRDAVIQWRFTQSHPSGVQPPPEPARTAAGAFAIDLRTFAVTTLDSQQAAAKVSGSHASAVAPSQLSSASNLYIKPQRAGDFYVGVALKSSASEISAIVARWRGTNGAPLPDIEVHGTYAASAISGDGADFLVVTVGKNGPNGARYTWSIYDIASGRALAELPLSAWAPPFFVHGSILVHESMPSTDRVGNQLVSEPLELHGLNLSTRIEVWKRGLRDTTFRGPRPPVP